MPHASEEPDEAVDIGNMSVPVYGAPYSAAIAKGIISARRRRVAILLRAFVQSVPPGTAIFDRVPSGVRTVESQKC